MNPLIREVILGLPLHFQKENRIKFFKCLSPAMDYLDQLLENLKAQTSLLYTKGIFLDYMGERYQEKRKSRNDEEYRKALMLKKYSRDTLPTTEFLLDLARTMTGKEVTQMKTRYKGEVASQYFRIEANQDFSTIQAMPNLNMVCEAGARMVWDIELSSEKANYYYNSVIAKETTIDINIDFEVNQKLHITNNLQYNSTMGIEKIINIGGLKI